MLVGALAVVAAASAWSPQHVSAPIRHTVVMRSRTQRYPHMSEDPPRGPLQEAWARYVLIRPEYDMDALKNSTKLRTAKSWSWEDRTPGTARTSTPQSDRAPPCGRLSSSELRHVLELSRQLRSPRSSSLSLPSRRW